MGAPAEQRHRTDVRRVTDLFRRDRAVDMVAPAALAVLALVTGSRWVDAPRSRVLPLLQALVPVTAFPTWVVLVALIVARRRWLASAAGALAAAHLARGAPVVLRRRPAAAVGDGDGFVVLASNLRFGHGDPTTIVDAVKTRDVDLLVLVEVTVEAHAALVDAGITALLPHAVGTPRADARAVMMLSRNPLRVPDAPPLPRVGYGAARATVVTPSREVVVAAVHPVTPVPDTGRAWHGELDGIARWAAAAPVDTPVVLAGDLNATMDHPVLRQLQHAGFVDAQRAAGRGRRATWPRVPGLSRISPVVQIDHVLVRGLAVVGAGRLVVPGSDHLAVWAELASARR